MFFFCVIVLDPFIFRNAAGSIFHYSGVRMSLYIYSKSYKSEDFQVCLILHCYVYHLLMFVIQNKKHSMAYNWMNMN